MKRHSLFLLLIAFMLIGTSRVMGQNNLLLPLLI